MPSSLVSGEKEGIKLYLFLEGKKLTARLPVWIGLKKIKSAI
jgi:hypothetical protein